MIATTMVLLLVLLGLSIPVGAALGVLGLLLDPLYSMLPADAGHRRSLMEHQQRIPAGRHSAVHHAGRIPAAFGPGGKDV